MKRRALIKRLKMAAQQQHLIFQVVELHRHTAVRIGRTTRTIGRHNEIDEVTAGRFFDQFADELGKGWWR